MINCTTKQNKTSPQVYILLEHEYGKVASDMINSDIPVVSMYIINKY